MRIMNLSWSWGQNPPQVCIVAFAGDMNYNTRRHKCPSECQKSITPSFLCGLQDCVLCVRALSQPLFGKCSFWNLARLRSKCHADFITALFITENTRPGTAFLLINNIKACMLLCQVQKHATNEPTRSPSTLRSLGEVRFSSSVVTKYAPECMRVCVCVCRNAAGRHSLHV